MISVWGNSDTQEGCRSNNRCMISPTKRQWLLLHLWKMISTQLQYRKLHITNFRNYFCILQHCFFVSPREKWLRTYYWAWASCYESFSRKAVKRCRVMHLCHRVFFVCVWWWWRGRQRPTMKKNIFKTYKCHFQLKHSDHIDKYI